MKKKGFTLIELLAVIIILAVIALIATPIVLNVVEKSKKEADKASANGIIDSAKLYYAEQYLNNIGSVNEYECTFTNEAGCDSLTISGTRPTKGTIKINSNGMVNGKLTFNENTFYICESNVLETPTGACSFIDYEQIYAITNEGMITGFKTNEELAFTIIEKVYASSLTIEAESYSQNKSIIIPEYVGATKVEGIASNALNGYEIEEITILGNENIVLETNSLPSNLKKLRVSGCITPNYVGYESIIETTACTLKTYKITYDLNGGTGEVLEQTKYENIDVNITNIEPIKEGSTFKGWSTNQNATEVEYESNALYNLNENKTLYAIWEKLVCSITEGDGTSIGDVITCGTESFYIYDTTGDNIKMLAKYNLEVGNSTNSSYPATLETNIQSSNAIAWNEKGIATYASVAFSSTSSSYEGSIVKGYVDAYKAILENMGVNVIDASLITKDELITLGCDESNHTCLGTPAFVTETSYWTGSTNDVSYVWFVDSIGKFNRSLHYYGVYFGLRPVITIPKSDIEI